MEKGDIEKNSLNIVKENLDKAELFNISRSDFENIRKIINRAMANPKKYEFPDYMIDKGFIEHFQITSSKETRKGAKYIREEVEFMQSYKQEFDAALSKKDHDNLLVFQKSRNISGHKHEYLLKSLKNRVNDHMGSLREYAGAKEIGIFVIQYFDDALNMRYQDYDKGEKEKIPYYKLSKDIKALSILADLEDKIKYVIFVGSRKDLIEQNRIPIYYINDFVEVIGLKGLSKKLVTMKEYCIYENAINSRSLVTWT